MPGGSLLSTLARYARNLVRAALAYDSVIVFGLFAPNGCRSAVALTPTPIGQDVPSRVPTKRGYNFSRPRIASTTGHGRRILAWPST